MPWSLNKLELSKNATPIQTKDLFSLHTWWRAQASEIGQSTWRGSDHSTNHLGTNSDAVMLAECNISCIISKLVVITIIILIIVFSFCKKHSGTSAKTFQGFYKLFIFLNFPRTPTLSVLVICHETIFSKMQRNCKWLTGWLRIYHIG